jgi:flavin-dependent dehydrogenase
VGGIVSQTDVLVIGGGPAGLAAAIAARLKGFEVTVVDASRPPIDKSCGEGIAPAGIEVLRQLGIELPADDALPFRGIRFLDGGASIEASFPIRPGQAVRRTRLHQILTDRASELGVRLLWDTCLGDGSELPSYRWLVGADGENSRVRHAAGLDAARSESRRFGFRRHYRISPWTDFVEVHWGLRCQVYVTPVSDHEVGIALLSRDSHLRLDTAIAEFPELQRRLHGARVSSVERGAVTVSRRLRRVFRGRTVLVGDASGSVDAITGEGLSLSFHHAIALSEALRQGRLASYQAEHSRLARRPAFVAAALLSLDRFPWLRRRVFEMLALDPPMFARLVTAFTT